MLQPFYSLPPYLKQKQKNIHPIFIPFAGCATRCIFCAQNVQSGQMLCNMDDIYRAAQKQINQLLYKHSFEPKPELAFFGGTFTCLSQKWQEKWLNLAGLAKDKEKISGVRCSTRPDAISAKHLAWLKGQGMQTIELGVQSFDDRSLFAANRGYTGEVAAQACQKVLNAGLNLVIQLMPGLPGCSPDVFACDIRRIIELKPAAVRIYPCLVLKETRLAEIWQEGNFQPWSLQECENHLGQALKLLWQANIPVIRLGLAPEQGLADNILAGPWHPALGGAVQAQALYLWVQEKLTKLPGRVLGLNIPKASQGSFWGLNGNLKPAYQALGINSGNVCFWLWPIWRFDLNLEQ